MQIHSHNYYLQVVIRLTLTTIICSVVYAAKITEVDQNTKFVGQIHLYNNVVNFPIPIWQQKAMLANGSRQSKSSDQPYKTYRKEVPGQIIIEMIPKNETFENWTHLFAILAYHVPKTPTITQMQNISRSIFIESCKKLSISDQVFTKITHKATLETYICSGLDDSQEGEIMVKYIGILPNGLIINIYQEWKSKGLQINDPTTWPISQETLKTTQKEFADISIYPIPKL
ncbi:MAG: hypothetical protein CMF52_02875 [Legionellales bacterium]|nr:hypothetical protein [Legionellales bacterium]HAV93834.1 hypothetical protein [Pseudomonadota bacterium]